MELNADFSLPVLVLAAGPSWQISPSAGVTHATDAGVVLWTRTGHLEFAAGSDV